MGNMQTVVETRHFAARAEKFLSENQRNELIDFLATHPLQGDVLAGTGAFARSDLRGAAEAKGPVCE